MALCLAVAFAFGGCGSDSADSTSVTVRTGSLSREVFAKRADDACIAAHRGFLADLEKFGSSHELPKSKAEEVEWLAELADQVVFPNLEPLIGKISEIGVPTADVGAVSTFLNALQKRLDEIRVTPKELNETPVPFKRVAQLAKVSGLKGCAENLV